MTTDVAAQEVAGLGEFTDPNCPSLRVERDRHGLALDGDGAVFDVGAFLDRRSARRACFAVAFFAVTRLIDKSPRSRSRVWWCTPRRAVS